MGVQSRQIVRKGSLVTFQSEKVAAHPFYSKFIGNHYKVTDVMKRGDRQFALIGPRGLLLPVALLTKVPQKKGKGA